MKEKKRILNDDIKASTVQIITDEDGNLGEMSLYEAKDLAKTKELDLMEV